MPHQRPVLAGLARLSVFLTTAGLTQGQHPDAKASPTRLHEPWRVPIHAAPASAAPAAVAPGCHAFGESFKASFHDGFVFDPVLGSDYPVNLPWRWTTESVTAGDVAQLAASALPVHAHTDWRYEYRWPDMTEAYDVRAEGVEQSFVFARAPHLAGDLVVRGRIDTDLRLATEVPTAGAHTPLLFADAQGRPIVRYGAAFAYDAAGRQTEVLTAWHAGRITLTVPGAWLAGAVWPVTIDPLTSSVLVNSGGAPLSDVVIENDTESVNFNTMVFYARATSAVLYDVVARLCDADFQNSVPVFAASNAAALGSQLGVAFVADADRWLLTYTAETTAGRRVGVYLHGKGNLSLNSGTLVGTGTVSGVTERDPAVGGARSASSGFYGLVAFVRESLASGPVLHAVAVDARTTQVLLLGPLSPSPGSSFEVGSPDVTNFSEGRFGSWIVVWQQRSLTIANDDTKTFAARVSPGFAVVGPTVLGPAGGTPVRHKLRPRVDGRGERYLVAMLSADAPGTSGTEILTERFDWLETAAQPTRFGTQVLSTANPQTPFSRPSVAYDPVTDSHWCVAWQVAGTVGINTTIAVRRVGSSGGRVESATISGSTRGGVLGPAVAYDLRSRDFQLAYYTPTTTSNAVFGLHLQYPADAVNVPYGAACGTATIDASPPYAGSERFFVMTFGLTSGTPCVLFLSFASAAIPLDGAGMPGCVFHVDPTAALLAMPTAAAGAGALLQLSLPDRSPFFGDLFLQWLYLQPGLNPAGLGATQGLRAQVR